MKKSHKNISIGLIIFTLLGYIILNGVYRDWIYETDFFRLVDIQGNEILSQGIIETHKTNILDRKLYIHIPIRKIGKCDTRKGEGIPLNRSEIYKYSTIYMKSLFSKKLIEVEDIDKQTILDGLLEIRLKPIYIDRCVG